MIPSSSDIIPPGSPSPYSPPAAWLWRTGRFWSSRTAPSGSGTLSGRAPVWAGWRRPAAPGSAPPGRRGTHRTRSWMLEKFAWSATATTFLSKKLDNYYSNILPNHIVFLGHRSRTTDLQVISASIRTFYISQNSFPHAAFMSYGMNGRIG